MTFPAIDSIETYGGAVEDYGVGVVDPTTDIAAADANQQAASVAGMTHVARQAWVLFVGHATTPTISDHDACWGDDSGVTPVPSKGGTGVYVLTWPTTVTDELDETHTLALRTAEVMSVSGSTAYHVQVAITSANVATVRVFDMAGVAADAAGVTIGIGVC